MVGLNTYINGLDLSRLTEYCINHGQLKQYAKGDYFVKEDEESRILPILNVDISTTKYIILLKEKTISQVLHLRVSSWVITQTVFQVKHQK